MDDSPDRTASDGLESHTMEAWFAIASTTWAPTTIRQTRSVLDRYLHPHLGGIRVGELTAAEINRTYAVLGERGGMRGQPLAPGTLSRAHVVLRAALAQAMRWGWIWDTPPSAPTGSSRPARS